MYYTYTQNVEKLFLKTKARLNVRNQSIALYANRLKNRLNG